MKPANLAIAAAIVITAAGCNDWNRPLQPTTCSAGDSTCATGLGNRSVHPAYETIYGNSPGLGR